jgi:glycosyltransferase involved in cell wall biosynthesis
MACGKTFVATDVGGIPDLTAGEYEEREAVRYFENAALTTRSATSLTAATLRLLGDPQLRQKMSEKAREFVSARFSASRLVGDLAALYESLLQESGMAVRAVTAREV